MTVVVKTLENPSKPTELRGFLQSGHERAQRDLELPQPRRNDLGPATYKALQAESDTLIVFPP